MLSLPSIPNPFFVPQIFRSRQRAVTLPPITTHDVEANPDKRARTLKHLLKLNHANHAIIYHNLHFHNHMPHILGSAYILGATSQHLNDIYEKDSKSLEPWRESPSEISDYDWRDYLGDPQYQRAYVDFFEDQLVQSGYDWKAVLNKYLFEGKAPLFNNLVAGLGHCLIHLGYAYELQSREIAMEALGLSACFYNFMHKYLDDPSYTRPPSTSSAYPPQTETLKILENIRSDVRFDDIPSTPGAIGIADLFKSHEKAILEHWNSWALPHPDEQFKEAATTPVALLVGTAYPSEENKEYDFFIVHLLTTSHAVRILLPIFPPQHHIPLLRQWFLFLIAVYIAQGRPKVDVSRFVDKDLKGRGWEFVEKEAREGKWSFDAHFVKALRSMEVAARTWGGDEKMKDFYLKGAVRMAEEFSGWGGFGALGEEEGGGH